MSIHKKIRLENNFVLHILSNRIATITNINGRRQTTYFGFETKEKAEEFKTSIESKRLCNRSIIRRGERLSMPWECKAWGITTDLIIHLLNR